MISIEVVFALPHQQTLLSLEVPPVCTVEQAIIQSGMLQHFPEIDLNHNKVGIFGQLTSLTRILQAGDRIEIYRPLVIDPKQARRIKAGF